MTKYQIHGGHALHGEIEISGAKNAAVAIIPAALMVDGVCRIENIPQISDVTLILQILRELGADDGLFHKLYCQNMRRFLGLQPRDFVHTSPACDDANGWQIGRERASAGPIRYATEHYAGNFRELLPVLDEAYALYQKDNVSVSGDEKTDILAGLLREYRMEAEK